MAKTPELGNRTSTRKSMEGKYLTFRLAKQEYGIPVIKVREIIGILKFTSIPYAPSHLRGVINLRGRVIPVVDLHVRFGWPPTPDTPLTCIIVIDVQKEEKTHLLGILVDEVSEVAELKEEQIDSPPELHCENGSSSSIVGMAKVGANIKILIDIDNVLTSDIVHTEASSATFRL